MNRNLWLGDFPFGDVEKAGIFVELDAMTLFPHLFATPLILLCLAAPVSSGRAS